MNQVEELLRIVQRLQERVAALEALEQIGSAVDLQHTHASAAEGGQLDVDNAFSDLVHDHSAAGEGGQLDWDVVWSDAVHSHASAGEGGQLDWDVVWSDAVHSHASDAEGGALSGYLAASGATTGAASQDQAFTNGVRILDGLHVGSNTNPDPDDIGFDGNLKSVKATVVYDVYGFCPLATPLTSTSWDGDAKSGASGTIDLSAVFGAPAGIKAIAVKIGARDETINVAFGVGPSSSYPYAVLQRTQVAGQYAYDTGVCPCDASGDIYFTQADELDAVYIEIYGYWI